MHVIGLAVCVFMARAIAYHEALTFRPLGQGLLQASFEFVQRLDLALDADGRQIGSFPKPIHEVFHEFQIQWLRLSMTRTRWMDDKWGHPSFAAAPIGVNLEACVPEGSAYGNVDDTWSRLVNALSGIVCTSLNLLSPDRTHFPPVAFAQDRVPATSDGQCRYLQGCLPMETVCTENLTPLLKLLPCGNRAGLASLLNPTRLFDAEFSQLDLQAGLQCSDASCSRSSLILTHRIHIVFNLLKWTGSCDWSVEKLFSRDFSSTCSGADPVISIAKDRLGKLLVSGKDLSDEVQYTVTNSLLTELGKDKLGKLGMAYGGLIPDKPPHRTPLLAVTAHLAGIGQERATLALHTRNKSSSGILVAQLVELPWYAKPLVHTLTVLVDGVADDSYALEYTPAIARMRPAMLHLSMSVPPNASLLVHVQVEKTLLKYTEYPFDPNRGLDINPIQTVFQDAQGKPKTVYTSPLLLTMPIPDFTMPYNVITLTCTLLAFFFGNIFNLFTRRFHFGTPRSKVASIKSKLGGLFPRNNKNE